MSNIVGMPRLSKISRGRSNSEFWEGIKLIWKIENFSCKAGKCLQSPYFGPNYPMWAVKIINESSHFISIELLQMKPVRYAFNCSFAILDSDGNPLVWKDKQIIDFGISYYFEHFIEMDVLRSKGTLFLPKGVLTVQCRIWKTDDGLISPESVFAITRIQPHATVEKTLTYTLDEEFEFDTFCPVQYLKRPDNGDVLSIKLALNRDNVFLLILKASFCRIDLNIKLSLIDSTGKKIEFANRYCNFERKHQTRYFNTNITKAMLMCYRNLYLPANTLSLLLTCEFLGHVSFNCMVKKNAILHDFPGNVIGENSKYSMTADEPETIQSTEPNASNLITQTLQEVLQEGFLSDFHLKVGHMLFRVHKVILGMRSRVFRAMFTEEMAENFVEIQNVDEGTLQRMLQFIYSDKYDLDMGWEKASSLYAAADKYALEPLKQGCSAILRSGLCLSSVLEVLSLADKHLDQDLKSVAMDFISMNGQNIIGTDRWKVFEKENAMLALETCRKLYLKKLKCDVASNE